MYKISVITSAYNTDVGYLRKYIQSLKSQSFTSYEVVIVDDCSTSEETRNFLNKMSEENDNVNVFFSEKNRGISASRNIALQMAQGDYICILDSDDYYSTDFLQNMYGATENGKADIVVGKGYTCVDENENFLRYTSNDHKITLYDLYRIPYGARLFKRKLLIENGILFPEGCIYEDNTFLLHSMMVASSVKYVEESGYINRIHTQSFSHSSAYATITYDRLPFDYLDNLVKIRDQLNPQKEMDVINSDFVEILCTCACFFCRKTVETEKKKIVSHSAQFIRKNIDKPILVMIKNAIKNSGQGISMKTIEIAYAIAVVLHMEILFSKIIHSILNKVN